MYIPKIKNGKLELYNERGIYQRTIQSSGVVYADINMPQTLIVITDTKGCVKLYNERGIYQRTIVSSDAASARWAGSDLAITDTKGRIKLYNERGIYQRTIS